MVIAAPGLPEAEAPVVHLRVGRVVHFEREGSRDRVGDRNWVRHALSLGVLEE